MIGLGGDSLWFSFPDVHEEASLTLNFQRTLRIPDDDEVHFLPPGLGTFPLRLVDDFASRVPEAWRQHGGVMIPMFQSEALWIDFRSGGYPCLVKVATGKINAVTGQPWQMAPCRDPQDYMVVPDQPWLDGFCVEEGVIRQFVAMPLGQGYTAEEQLTGQAEHGGLQLAVYPMKAAAWEKWKKERARRPDSPPCSDFVRESSMEMGLSPGGRMRQKLHKDPHHFEVWDLDHVSRCFVHIANSITWRAITGEAPPTMPPTARDYTEAGLPWFNHYRPAAEALPGAEELRQLKSVKTMGIDLGQKPLPENDPPGKILLREL